MGNETLNEQEDGFWKGAAKDAFVGTLFFILGFVVGTVVDLTFFNLYKAIDPTEDSVMLLTVLGLVQILLSIFIAVVIQPLMPVNQTYSSYFRIALLASQVFMMGHTISTVSKNLYTRESIRDTK